MATTTLKMILLGEDKSASKAMRGLRGETEKTSGAVGSMGGLALKAFGAFMAYDVAGKIADFGMDAAQSYAQLEDASAAAATIFGDSMGQITAQADGAARTLGMSKSQVIDAANTFGTYGKAAGLAGDDLAGFSTEMTQLAGDMASFRGTSPEQAIEAIGAALRGETEPIRAYGVMLDDAALRNEAMKMGLISTTKDALTPQQKTLAAQSLILQQTSDAQGDFARTQDSTANSAKSASAQFENLKATVGEKLAPAYDRLIDLGSQAMTFLEENPEVIDGVIGAFELLGKAVDFNLRMMLPGLAIVTEGISQLIGVVAGMLRALGTVPGFGWATEAANQLDTVKDGAHAVAQAIEGVVTQKDVSINTNAPQATQRIQTTRAALVSIPASVQSQISTPGATWSKQAIDDLRAAIGRLPASSQTSFRALLDRGQYSEAANELSRLAQPRTVTLRVQVSGGTAIYRYGKAQAFQADGGVRFFAGGGGFGRENHVAQIARPGEWRIWAEDETGGESYIPLARSKRARSLRIWAETGRLLGVRGFDDGAVVGGGGGGSLDGWSADAIAAAVERGLARSTLVIELDGKVIDARVRSVQAGTARGLGR